VRIADASRPGRRQLAAVSGQRGAHQFQVGEQLRRPQVVTARPVCGPGRQPGAGVGELRADAAGLEPVRLLGVDPAVALTEFGQRVQVGREARGQVERDAAHPTGHAQLVDEPVAQPLGQPDAVLVRDQQYFAGDGRGDVRVAVAVAADPRPERERTGGRRQRHAQVRQRVGEVLEHLGRGVVGEVGEVVDGVAGLVGWFGPLQAQFVGLPEQVDQLGEAAVGGLPVGPAVDGGWPAPRPPVRSRRRAAC
jgi:hypothetical protein